MNNKKGRSIELFFVDGSPDGMVTATIPFQWSGHVLVTQRTQLKEAIATRNAELMHILRRIRYRVFQIRKCCE